MKVCALTIEFWLLVDDNRAHHLSGKAGNVTQFGSCQGSVRKLAKSQGLLRKTVYLIVSFIFLAQGSEKPFYNKPNPTGFFVFLGVLA